MSNGDLLSPFSLFLLSIIIFILMRPILSLFDDSKIIEIGMGVDELNIAKAIVFVVVVVNFISLTFYISAQKISRVYDYIPIVNVYNKFLGSIFFVFALIFSSYFFYMSYKGMLKLASGVDYFQFASGEEYGHLKYFFYSKFCFLVSYFFSKKRISIVFVSFCCFFFSIGFIIIGLRGYTIAYLFLFLSIINLKYRVNFFVLFFLAILILIISSIVLNFRLGFDVSTSYFEMFLNPFHQQGASFEVVFGAVNFKDELLGCIDYMGYFLKEDFGSCVDTVRGVYFQEGGGFGSSYFAELYYFGFLFSLVNSIVFGVGVSFLVAAYSRLKRNLYSDKFSGVVVFLIVPNLVYFARSSAFDFVTKIFEVVVLILFLLLFKKMVSKNEYI